MSLKFIVYEYCHLKNEINTEVGRKQIWTNSTAQILSPFSGTDTSRHWTQNQGFPPPTNGYCAASFLSIMAEALSLPSAVPRLMTEEDVAWPNGRPEAPFMLKGKSTASHRRAHPLRRVRMNNAEFTQRDW